jgi:hypothetical protein
VLDEALRQRQRLRCFAAVQALAADAGHDPRHCSAKRSAVPSARQFSGLRSARPRCPQLFWSPRTMSMVAASITGAAMKTRPSIASPSSTNAESAVRASKHDPQITKREIPWARAQVADHRHHVLAVRLIGIQVRAVAAAVSAAVVVEAERVESRRRQPPRSLDPHPVPVASAARVSRITQRPAGCASGAGGVRMPNSSPSALGTMAGSS